MKIYVASSWRNQAQPEVVQALKAAGHEVYDFKNPEPGNHGFAWSEIDLGWQSWSPEAFRAALAHPVSRRGFALDMGALEACDACVLVHPSGRSAHLEAGYAVGAKKPLFVLLAPDEPELMLSMATALCLSLDEVLKAIEAHTAPPCPTVERRHRLELDDDGSDSGSSLRA